jgi:DASH complex subunit ASK1
MSRASSASQQRSLSLTEELEKLEQSITLTLQGWTTPCRLVLLPTDDFRNRPQLQSSAPYCHVKHSSDSRAVCTAFARSVGGLKGQGLNKLQHSCHADFHQFWKQFFESSANVSLSGYEEQPSTHQPIDESVTEDSSATTHTTLETSQSYETPSSQHISTLPAEQELDLSSLTISPSHSTPRANAAGQPRPGTTATFPDYPSPYEALRQEVGSTTNPEDMTSIKQPRTPGKSPATTTLSQDIAMTPDSSPFVPTAPTSIPRPSTARKKTDPLLHRVLDRNYRVQATPLASARRGYQSQGTRANAPANATATPGTTARTRLLDDALSSSPDMPAAPQLHAEIFSSPAKPVPRRTPGVSVLTPAKPNDTTARKGIWDSDDEFDDDDDDDNAFGSPPKTMQFHVPQSRLLKTPGKSASWA